MWHDGVSTTILVPSCDTTASQRPFWSHRATRRHLNGHFGPIVRHDGVSMVILAPSCDTTASQWSFWSHHATRRRLNGHFGPIMRHDGVSTVILVSSRGGTASQWPFMLQAFPVYPLRLVRVRFEVDFLALDDLAFVAFAFDGADLAFDFVDFAFCRADLAFDFAAFVFDGAA